VEDLALKQAKAMPDSLSIQLLGPVRVARGVRKINLGARRERAVLALLTLQGGAISRRRLASQLWPESDQPEGLSRLRRLLYRMTGTLGADVFEVGRQDVDLTPLARAATDIAQLRACLHRGLYRPSHELDAADVAALERAGELCGHELAEGLIIDECEELSSWLAAQRESLQQTRRQVLARLAGLYEEQGNYACALGCARVLVALDPLQEASQRQLIRLFGATGQIAAALRQFEQCRATLQTELGVEPDAETLRVMEELRRSADTSAVYVRDLRRTSSFRFTRNGDVHLAYQTFGDGPVDLLIISGFVSHLEQTWDTGGPGDFLRELAGRARLILFDRRGVGLSDRTSLAAPVDTSAADALAVLDAAGSRRSLVFGFSEGGPIAIQLAVARPERVTGLGLWGTMAKGSASEDYPWALTPQQIDQWLDHLVAEWGTPVSIKAFAPDFADDPTLRRWWSRMLRLGSSPGNMRAVLRTLAITDLRSQLQHVSVPTLVMHRREDRAVRIGAGRHLAEKIPNARWLELPGATHWWWLGDTAPIRAALIDLLDGASAGKG
jgi:DNA-binding SARP family transcriptional activator/pimeloyl-ACP methyl ester carboxylesterase